MNAPEGAARLARLEAAEAEAWAQTEAALREYASAGKRLEAANKQWRRCRDDLAALRRELAEGARP